MLIAKNPQLVANREELLLLVLWTFEGADPAQPQCDTRHVDHILARSPQKDHKNLAALKPVRKIKGTSQLKDFWWLVCDKNAVPRPR